VGIETGDDAGVIALGDGRALVQSVDIFTPVVDSPEDWGRIAAANALSDLYAMGATPLTALQFLAWPRDDLPFDVATRVVAAGMDVMALAGCTVVGGHSVDGPEPWFGYAVTGMAPAEHIITNAGARPGDVLVLTKPLGMGIITTAIKRGRCPEDLAASAIDLMSSLNDRAGSSLDLVGAHAATDVTGFGLLGHLREMCRASGVGARVEAEAVPVLAGVRDLLADGMWAGGSQRNLRSLEPDLETDLAREEIKLLVDAQTSGGLLVALAESSVPAYQEAVPGSHVIGSIISGSSLVVA